MSNNCPSSFKTVGMVAAAATGYVAVDSLYKWLTRNKCITYNKYMNTGVSAIGGVVAAGTIYKACSHHVDTNAGDTSLLRISDESPFALRK